MKIGLMLNIVVTVLTGMKLTQYNIRDEAMAAKHPLMITVLKAISHNNNFILVSHKPIDQLL